MRDLPRGLERLGITPEQWLEHVAVLEGEPEITLQVCGGVEVLRSALEAAGVGAYRIISRHPLEWGMVQSRLGNHDV